MNITLFIIIITSLISITAFGNNELFNKLKFNAYAIHNHKQWFRFITYGLVHAGWAHLVINMLVLYSFGDLVEQYFSYYFAAKGMLFYLLLYIGGIILSTVYAYEKHKGDAYYNAVGASGAVSAVLFASIILHPTGKIMMLFFPVPIPAPIFGILYLVFSAYMARRGDDNIGHDAHFFGAIFGILFLAVLKPELFIIFMQQVKNIF
jgi:membrane associated rhomboid family serine protease